MNRDIIDDVIFSPGRLAISLSDGLTDLGHEVTFFTPGKIKTKATNINADLSGFKKELKLREDTYIDLLKKHPLIFISLARQVQAELTAKCFEMANKGKFDIVHIYTNEEEIGLVFARFCNKPIVFTHHEPFNFLTKYRAIFPKYKSLNWISISNSQRSTMPKGTNFVANIYHGLDKNTFHYNANPSDYIAYFGRIIEPKGVIYAIKAAKLSGIKIKIAGKHYAEYSNDRYWEDIIKPHIDGKAVEFVGYIKDDKEKEKFLGNAKCLLMPSTWDEPFGLSMIEALACGTPVIGFRSGSIPEVIDNGKSGFIVMNKSTKQLVSAIKNVDKISRLECRKIFEQRFSAERMCKDHEKCYRTLIK